MKLALTPFIREPEEFFFETLYDLNRDFAELVPGDVAHLLRISATICGQDGPQAFMDMFFMKPPEEGPW